MFLLTSSTERLHHRWPVLFPPQRDRRPQGPVRVRHLLQHHQRRPPAAAEALPDLQAHVPRQLSVQVVQDQQCQHVPALQERFQLQLGGLKFLNRDAIYCRVVCGKL